MCLMMSAQRPLASSAGIDRGYIAAKLDVSMTGKTSRMYRLRNANNEEYLSETPGTFGGNLDGKYGRLDCPAALRSLANGPRYRTRRVFFADEATAKAAGYRSCAVCMPEEYRAWKIGAERRLT
jgi:hypothetical protein